MRHALKTWPDPFWELALGRKSHEIRQCDDRTFAVGDLLQLDEFDPETEQKSGRVLYFKVTAISLPGEWGLPENLCVMSIRRMSIRRQYY